MHKYLVVANQTLGGEHLIEEARRRALAGPSSFYVVVPNSRAVDAVRASGAPIAAVAVAGVSRWLGMDLPSRVERKFKLPATTVTARA